jgi:hypothetical protein
MSFVSCSLCGSSFPLQSLFPCNIVELVSTSLDEVETLVERAEAIKLPDVSEYRADFAMYACLYPFAVFLPTDLAQSAQPIHTNAFGEPSVSGVFSTALPAPSM